MGIGFSRSGFRSMANSRRPSDAPKAGDATPRATIDPCSALFRKLLRRTLTLVFFCHPFVTFDYFWHHHSRHEHHPPPPPPPSSEYPLRCKRLRSFPRRGGELSLVRWWLAGLCISTTSIHVPCASSTVRCDGNLNEGAVLTCCDMCICRRNSRNFLWRDDFM